MQLFGNMQRWYFQSFLPWFDNLSDARQKTVALLLSSVFYVLGAMVMLFSFWVQMPNKAFSATPEPQDVPAWISHSKLGTDQQSRPF